ncbi:unnamed protein product [Blepharisma stoltei]|uniref:Uncharacterized protein n=1 Tax=Blepharisma stoltei TaxID=1481888 RepID=A0AAU9JJB6_9CILI|nr:unnamed protein product [Blepharisma stoltei]
MLYDFDILMISMVKVVSYVGCLIIVNSPWETLEKVPHVYAFSRLVPGSFYLEGSCSCSPREVMWQMWAGAEAE